MSFLAETIKNGRFDRCPSVHRTNLQPAQLYLSPVSILRCTSSYAIPFKRKVIDLMLNDELPLTLENSSLFLSVPR